jgi:putative DNA primase/helicase
MINAHGEIVGAQIIHTDGSKIFISGSTKQGSWHWLMHEPTMHNLSRLQRDVFERRRQDDIIAVVEGWATGCAVANLKGLTRVAVAFDAGNLVHVVKRLLVLYPHNPIMIFADDDDINQKTGKQSGKAGAEAARVLDPLRIGIEYPLWRDGKKPDGASDFNDLFVDFLNKQ